MTTFAGHLLTGDHASRPAANTVPDGTLYSCTDHGIVYQADEPGNTWNDWATLGGVPGAHASSHETAGADPIDLSDQFVPVGGGTFTGDVNVPDEAYDATAWNGSTEVPTKNAIRDKLEAGVTPAAHASSHEDAGGDEIDVTGLSGELADAQKVAVHKNGALVGTRKNLNLIEGTNVTLTVADDAGDDEVDVTIDAAGGGSSLPLYHDRNYWGWLAHPGVGTSFFDVGEVTAMSVVLGTVTAAQDADAAWIRCTTGAVSGNNSAAFTGGFNLCRRGWEPVFVAKIKTYTSLADLRLWLGLSSVDARASDDPAGSLAMFRFSTSAGDTDIMACTKDGTTLNAVSTGVTPATDTIYDLRIECVGSNILFYVNNVLTNTISANLPAAATLLGAHYTLTTLAAAAKSILISSLKGSHLQ